MLRVIREPVGVEESLFDEENCRPVLCLSHRQTWQNGGFIRFTKGKDLFSRYDHVRVFEILRVLFFFFFFKSRPGGNELELQL